MALCVFTLYVIYILGFQIGLSQITKKRGKDPLWIMSLFLKDLQTQPKTWVMSKSLHSFILQKSLMTCMLNEALLSDSNNVHKKHLSVPKMYLNCFDFFFFGKKSDHRVISYLVANALKIYACKIISICGVVFVSVWLWKI